MLAGWEEYKRITDWEKMPGYGLMKKFRGRRHFYVIEVNYEVFHQE